MEKRKKYVDAGKRVKIKRGGQAGKDVTDEQKNALIQKAMTKWEAMGLTKEQMALGVATMNVESGFNPTAKGDSDTEKGLGQITKDTWKDAVNEYNGKHPNEKKIDHNSASDRLDVDTQIKVMGEWLKKAWDNAGNLARDPDMKVYTREQLAYGLWHEGVYVDEKKKGLVKKFLDNKEGDGFNKGMKDSFNDTYKIILEEHAKEQVASYDVKVEDVLTPSRLDTIVGFVMESVMFEGAGYGYETLRREGDQVWRIEADGSTRGYFYSP